MPVKQSDASSEIPETSRKISRVTNCIKITEIVHRQITTADTLTQYPLIFVGTIFPASLAPRICWPNRKKQRCAMFYATSHRKHDEKNLLLLLPTMEKRPPPQDKQQPLLNKKFSQSSAQKSTAGSTSFLSNDSCIPDSYRSAFRTTLQPATP